MKERKKKKPKHRKKNETKMNILKKKKFHMTLYDCDCLQLHFL